MKGGRRVSAERWAEIGFAARVARIAEADKRGHELLPVIETIKAAGATSLREIAAALNAQGITAPRRGVLGGPGTAGAEPCSVVPREPGRPAKAARKS